ncbi:hypothetical protein GGI10_003765, partial [Coemansia sp. RSA 2530]
LSGEQVASANESFESDESSESEINLFPVSGFDSDHDSDSDPDIKELVLGVAGLCGVSFGERRRLHDEHGRNFKGQRSGGDAATSVSKPLGNTERNAVSRRMMQLGNAVVAAQNEEQAPVDKAVKKIGDTAIAKIATEPTTPPVGGSGSDSRNNSSNSTVTQPEERPVNPGLGHNGNRRNGTYARPVVPRSAQVDLEAEDSDIDLYPSSDFSSDNEEAAWSSDDD